MKKLLKESSFSLKEITYQADILIQITSVVCLKMIGCSPKEYRKQVVKMKNFIKSEEVCLKKERICQYTYFDNAYKIEMGIHDEV